MKRLLFAIAIMLSFAATGLNTANAQFSSNIDSLQKVYNKTRSDTLLVYIYLDKISFQFSANLDTALNYDRKALNLSRKINFRKGEVYALSALATSQARTGDLPGSLKTTFETLPKALAIHEMGAVAACYNVRSIAYGTLKDYKRALDNLYEMLHITTAYHLNNFEPTALNNIARLYLDIGKLDSAQYFNQRAYDLGSKSKLFPNRTHVIRNFGIIKFMQGDPAGAINYYRKSLADTLALKDRLIQSEDYRRMAQAYQKMGRADSCLACGKMALEAAQLNKNPNLVQQAATLLTEEYQKKKDFQNAFYYLQLTQAAKDSLFSQQKNLQVQNLAFNEQQRQEEARDAQASYQNRVRDYTLLGIIAVFVLVACILLYANSRRKKANAVLQNTLSDLKKTQTQLVQSEKMASLGELTAGIAHEIQNPLNFVNNFSEVNTELIGEMEEEIARGNLDEVKAIAADIKDNQLKINQHGKRADFIVKGMLQHSRKSSGEKQPTNMNVLCDEFLKLSFHGLRARDKSFNAEMETHFAPNPPSINVSQQDMGRVMLNLFNNAFYAVNQKTKTVGADYRPTVEVSTSAVGGEMRITVRDNGNGIPESIKDKIMQPFFTTKPTGEGTGLGLSLSYDIVVKGHGGKIDLISTENIGSEFTISLPIG